MSSLHSQVGKDNEAMEEDYQKAFELFFVYGYRCCAFKHSICRDQLEIPDGMPNSANPLPLEFFVNPRCPPGHNSRRGQGCRDRSGRRGEGSKEGCRCKRIGLTSFPMLVLVIFGDFSKGHHFATNMRIIFCNPWRFLAHFNEI